MDLGNSLNDGMVPNALRTKPSAETVLTPANDHVEKPCYHRLGLVFATKHDRVLLALAFSPRAGRQ